MENCHLRFEYPSNQEQFQSILRTIGGFATISSLTINLLTIAFVLRHHTMRQKNICSLNLFLLNTGECLFTLIALVYTKHKGTLIPGRGRFRFFFLLGQVMTIGLIIAQRIHIAAGNMTSVSHITRNPTTRKHRNIFLTLIITVLAVNIVLTLVLSHKFLTVAAIFVAINLSLYIVLLLKLKLLQHTVGGAVRNICKRAILYVTLLLLGFIMEIAIALPTNAMLLNRTSIECPPRLSPATTILMCIYSLRFIWDPAVFFLFNGEPRTVLKQKCKQIIDKIQCCRHKAQCTDQAAVIPFPR